MMNHRMPLGMNSMDYLRLRQEPPLSRVYDPPLGRMEPVSIPEYRNNNVGPGWIAGDNELRRIQKRCLPVVPVADLSTPQSRTEDLTYPDHRRLCKMATIN